MKWLSKLFKTSSSSRRGGGGGNGGYNPHFLVEENMVVRDPARTTDDRPRTKKEQEELDHAIALSLSEGYNEWRTGDNSGGALPRGADDGSMNSSTCPPYGTLQYHPAGYRVCAGCHREIEYRDYSRCLGAYFHPNCFCSVLVVIRSPSMRSFIHLCSKLCTISLLGRDPYHKTCFETHLNCEVCLPFIPTNGAGLIEYRWHRFWYQKHCPSHEHDNTARFCSCEHLESWNVRYYSLEDGQRLCLECMESAIMDTGDCQPLYHAIRDYYGLNMKLYQRIPILLVERQALIKLLLERKMDIITCLRQGVCVSSKSRQSPVLLTGAILAHELTHGWLRLKGYGNLKLEVEEGICEVLSCMWLESEVLSGSSNRASTSAASSSSSSKKGGKSNVENKLGEFFVHQIDHHTSPAYGGGFRAANAAVNKYALHRTLDHIRLTGNFPL
ncbi:hypothetical protein CRYUN_Cryun05aG0156100 [Craigia yunnanensis]